MKIRSRLALGCSVAVLMASAAEALAQSSSPAAGKSPAPLVPLKVDVVISRYQGDRKVSSLPYTLAVNANDDTRGLLNGLPGSARLRSGASVPIPSVAPSKESPGTTSVGPVQYKSIGTGIDCSARSTDDGRYRLEISIEDTSVYPDEQAAPGIAKINAIPSFRTFQSNNALILKDGQSIQFTMAADRITSEITRVDVTLTVVK